MWAEEGEGAIYSASGAELLVVRVTHPPPCFGWPRHPATPGLRDTLPRLPLRSGPAPAPLTTRQGLPAELATAAAMLRNLLFVLAMSVINAFRAPLQRIHGAVRAVSLRAGAASTAAPLTDAASVRGAYDKLCDKLKLIERLGGVEGLLGWDEQTMMPAGGAEARGAQKAALAEVKHGQQTSGELGELISSLRTGAADAELSDDERAVVREASRDYSKATRLTPEIAARQAMLEAKGLAAWQTARKEDDWAGFAPVLEEIFALRKEVCAAEAPELVECGRLYDAAVDRFERGMTEERLSAFFSELKAGLVPLLQRIQKASPRLKEVPEALQGGSAWGAEDQASLSRTVAEAMGFDFSRGRLDMSAHPFTGGPAVSDVRITTRYSEDNWLEGIGATVHETGHAMYEQNRLKTDLPTSRALSMGVHESQSLLWERMVFQGRSFWDWAAPKLHEAFPHTKGVTAEELYAFANLVKPGLIRVEADEVTYPLHVILRFELERDLVLGRVAVDELPELWRQKMADSLGVEVPDDKDGVLQDVHWPAGAIGYFPSYSLGAVMAWQLYAKAKEEMPDLEEDIAAGRFAGLKDWLRVKIHERGSMLTSLDELLVEATGRPLDAKGYIAYLEAKYEALYEGM